MKVSGPIPVTSTSHLFSSMQYSRKVIEIKEFDFVEEEYFILGQSNIYDWNEIEQKVNVFEENLDYTTRIIVRRPADNNIFSGIGYVDIMNASNGYDIEDLWRRSYLHIMENNHLYIGVTTKPINVLSLKNFDYQRYQSLNWSNGKVVNSPAVANPVTMSIDGTEEGLVWDILHQLGIYVKEDSSAIGINKKVQYLYLTGQSQSGMYLNTYVNYMHPYYEISNKSNPYDGYLSLASGGLTRSLRQEPDNTIPMAMRAPHNAEISHPYIQFNTENDYYLFKMFGGEVKPIENSNTPTNKKRYYDMTGAAHTDAASPLVPLNSEIIKTKCPPRILDNEYEYRLNDLPFDYYINGILNKLHHWVVTGEAPEIIEPLMKNQAGEFLRDEFGHTLGGVRSPFIDVPKAKYQASYDGKASTNGTMTFFTEDEIKQLYGSKENYYVKFEEYIEKQVQQGLITQNDAKRACAWAMNIWK
ncbi:hypothetical protein KBI51_05410 [Aerococcaceae bacterium zg-ZUI334]|uniref:alpha/beta hydrolase domain-containing protein n=1 Tax=Aerococcaceae bacterium zg-252 TaxID=2796928 RepID=UPI001B9B3331|nr:hypothetical protein [Aerococcaceae bacterium zg-ZUI334]